MAGATFAPVVYVLLWTLFPLAYPISKLLDLKTLVALHANEAGKGGQLTDKETTIISGALELIEKAAKDAMTPVSDIFSVDVTARLDRALLHTLLENGHSRVPVYHEEQRNIIGLILVKSLLTINPTDDVPIKNIPICRIPRISESMPLYDILNEFQKGLSHIALVQRYRSEKVEHSSTVGELRLNIYGASHPKDIRFRSRRSLRNLKGLPGSSSISRRETSKTPRWSEKYDFKILDMNDDPLPSFTKEEEVVGIITMEDVIEQLLKDEIYDEKDHQGVYSSFGGSAIREHHFF